MTLSVLDLIIWVIFCITMSVNIFSVIRNRDKEIKKLKNEIYNLTRGVIKR